MEKKTGIVVAGGNGGGSFLTQFSYPEGLYLDDNETIYIADSWNHRIIEWKKDSKTGQNSTYGEIIIPNIGCNC